MGFYYNAYLDYSMCLFCENWNFPDELRTESDRLNMHRFDGPRCPLLWNRPCKNIPISEEELNNLLEEPTPMWVVQFWNKTIVPLSLIDKITNLENDTQHKNNCKMCYDAKINITTLPCRHTGMCQKCSAKLKQCPFCWMRIDSTIKIY